jgi:UDP-2,3-diacylglucosamine pyrophosphatase LpxH
MHQRLLSALKSLTEVRLVAALRDDRLGFADSNDLRVFVPDIHLISTRRQREGGFRFSTNQEDLLIDVFDTLRTLKRGAAANETVAVYVMGDFLDLWREEPVLNRRSDAAAVIRDDHEDLVVAALDPALRARFLLGNHDFDLHRWPDYVGWDRRYFLPDRTLQAPSVILMHGDAFDWIEKLPDSLQQIMVYFFAPHLSPNSHELGEIGRLVARSHGRRNYRTYIQAATPPDLGALQVLGTGTEVPERHNVVTSRSGPKERLKHLSSAWKETSKANQKYQMNLRVMFIGHTHGARIAVRETPGGEFFALIDCGAWIEDCSWTQDGRTLTAPSAQIAALCNNEVRIYQLGEVTAS